MVGTLSKQEKKEAWSKVLNVFENEIELVDAGLSIDKSVRLIWKHDDLRADNNTAYGICAITEEMCDINFLKLEELEELEEIRKDIYYDILAKENELNHGVMFLFPLTEEGFKQRIEYIKEKVNEYS